MSATQERLVTAAHLLAESAWLTALLGMLSLPLGGNGSPFPWAAALGLMGVSALTARALSVVRMPSLAAYAAQMAVGFGVVYLTVGAQAAPEFSGVNLAWPAELGSEQVTREYMVRAVLGSFGGVALWWRGGHAGGSDFPTESLSSSFKVGIFVLAVAAAVDIFHQAELNVFPLMFVFFAAGVAGLSIGHMTAASGSTTSGRAWTRVIGGIVGALVVAGLLFSLLQREALAIIAKPLVFLLDMLLRVVVFVIILPLAYIFDFLIGAVLALVEGLRPEQEPQVTLNPPSIASTVNALGSGGDDNPVALLLFQILQWSFVAAIIVGLLVVMALAYRRRARRLRARDDGEREQLREDANIAYDFANLLFGMLPSRLRRTKERRVMRVPDEDPNIADVFRIYFGLLTLAEKRGSPKPPGETPGEFCATLERVFPSGLARNATDAFNRACYGNQPTPRTEIDRMRAELEREAGTAPKNDKG